MQREPSSDPFDYIRPTRRELTAALLAASEDAPLLANASPAAIGWGDGPEDWLEECSDCQRRTASAGGQTMAPPPIITLWCEGYIPPDRPEDQRLRGLAAQLRS